MQVLNIIVNFVALLINNIKIMKIETEKLMTFNNYANKIGKSRVWVDKLAQRGDIKSTKIDGVKFVILEG